MTKWKCQGCKAMCELSVKDTTSPHWCIWGIAGDTGAWRKVEQEQPLAECNQLPKLTTEVFNRPDCPEWAKYAVVDVQGLAYWYQYSPLADERIGVWKAWGNKRQLIDGFFDKSNWQNSLVERPAKTLPKLTADVFNRADFPKTAKYAVVTKDGGVTAYTHKPYINKEIPCWGFNRGCSFTVATAGSYDSSDWQNSLIERPAVLPDWCKVGEWCYCGIGRNKYTKIKKVLAESILAGEYDTYTADFINSGKLLPARLRPYNADEMKALIGKVIAAKEDCAIVTGYRGCENKIILTMKHNRYSADDLLKIHATINGAPCGVLEHLQGGEWVQ